MIAPSKIPPAETEAVLLSFCNERWQKVASITEQTLQAFEKRGLPAREFDKRILHFDLATLVRAGQLEARGDDPEWQNRELRLAATPANAAELLAAYRAILASPQYFPDKSWDKLPERHIANLNAFITSADVAPLVEVADAAFAEASAQFAIGPESWIKTHGFVEVDDRAEGGNIERAMDRCLGVAKFGLLWLSALAQSRPQAAVTCLASLNRAGELFRQIALYANRGDQFSLSREMEDYSSFVTSDKAKVQSDLEQAATASMRPAGLAERVRGWFSKARSGP
jgi:hypothetical protein